MPTTTTEVLPYENCYICEPTASQPEPISLCNSTVHHLGDLYLLVANRTVMELTTPKYPNCPYQHNVEWVWKFIVSQTRVGPAYIVDSSG